MVNQENLKFAQQFEERARLVQNTLSQMRTQSIDHRVVEADAEEARKKLDEAEKLIKEATTVVLISIGKHL